MCASLFARIVLLSLGVGALPVEKIVRREQVQLAASGELLNVAQAKKKTKDYCNWDFPLGDELTDVCPTGSEKLLEKPDCEEAARQAGLKHLIVDTMDENYQWERPKGCFMELCPEAGVAGQSPTGGDGNGPCYRWNNVEPKPNNVTSGTPVCSRDRVKYGTIVDQGGGSFAVKCPGPDTHYAEIKEEDLCLADGKCIGDSDAQNDLVNNFDANEYDKYPLYCFLDTPAVGVENQTQTVSSGELLETLPGDTPKVYFNAPLHNIDPETSPPTAPVGMPICNVTQITWFDEEGTLTPLRGCVRDSHNDCVSLGPGATVYR